MPVSREELRLRLITRVARRAFHLRSTLRIHHKIPVAKTFKEVITTEFGPVTLYFYYPMKRQENYPLFINIHGGGFVIGTAGEDDSQCRYFCHKLNAVVMNIEYSLAPEKQFPIQIEECYHAINWILSRTSEFMINPSQVIVGGHSAGANISAVCSILSKERKHFSFMYQVLLCPYIDLATPPEQKNQSDDKSKIIMDEAARHFVRCYLRKGDEPTNPLISPVYASPELLENLPPAVIVTAGSDNLWPEGSRYASMLEKAGIEVHYRHFPGMSHSFIAEGQGPKKERLEALHFVTDNIKLKLI